MLGKSSSARRTACAWLAGALVLSAFATTAGADVISFSGRIIQAQDPSTPATNNPSLNAIQLDDPYVVMLSFTGAITAPGAYPLTGSSLSFADAAAGATETSFGLIKLTITANGLFDDVSLLGCLITGTDCFVGNELDANFRIPAASLNAPSVVATGLDQPHPLDLLEDDDLTDIHGSIVAYSYVRVVAVPTPSSALLVYAALVVLGAHAWRRRANTTTSA